MNQVFWGNSLQLWLIAIAISLVSFLVLRILTLVLAKRLEKLAKNTTNQVDNLVSIIFSQTKSIFLIVVAVFVGARWVTLEPGVMQAINVSTMIMLWIQIGIWLNHAAVYWFKSRDVSLTEGEEKTTLNAISLVVRILLWSIVFILAIDNIPGVEITALIASLGIGGIAVGLALQNILTDLFGSLSIALDKPFVIGDFINVGDFTGSVENIGLKSTRVRAITGEEVVFSNSDLLNSRIRNFKTMQQRRVVLNIGVTYDTTAEQLKEIPEIIRVVVEQIENITFERAHLSELGDFAIIFQLVYIVESSDFKQHMDTQQEILINLIQEFNQKNIAFAFPTQSIYLENQAN